MGSNFEISNHSILSFGFVFSWGLPRLFACGVDGRVAATGALAVAGVADDEQDIHRLESNCESEDGGCNLLFGCSYPTLVHETFVHFLVSERWCCCVVLDYCSSEIHLFKLYSNDTNTPSLTVCKEEDPYGCGALSATRPRAL
jgi:hypothetical protein